VDDKVISPHGNEKRHPSDDWAEKKCLQQSLKSQLLYSAILHKVPVSFAFVTLTISKRCPFFNIVVPSRSLNKEAVTKRQSQAMLNPRIARKDSFISSQADPEHVMELWVLWTTWDCWRWGTVSNWQRITSSRLGLVLLTWMTSNWWKFLTDSNLSSQKVPHDRDLTVLQMPSMVNLLCPLNFFWKGWKIACLPAMTDHWIPHCDRYPENPDCRFDWGRTKASFEITRQMMSPGFEHDHLKFDGDSPIWRVASSSKVSQELSPSTMRLTQSLQISREMRSKNCSLSFLPLRMPRDRCTSRKSFSWIFSPGKTSGQSFAILLVYQSISFSNPTNHRAIFTTEDPISDILPQHVHQDWAIDSDANFSLDSSI
jgi:hypothetical protein